MSKDQKNIEFNLFIQKVANNIKRIRENASLTQEQCSELTGIEYKYYQRIEQAQANITIKTLLKISKVLSINPNELLK